MVSVRPADATGAFVPMATVRGKPNASLSWQGFATVGVHESQGVDRTPAGLMLSVVAVDVYVLGPTVMPEAFSIAAAPRVTVAVGPVPLAWYMNESGLVPVALGT